MHDAQKGAVVAECHMCAVTMLLLLTWGIAVLVSGDEKDLAAVCTAAFCVQAVAAFFVFM